MLHASLTLFLWQLKRQIFTHKVCGWVCTRIHKLRQQRWKRKMIFKSYKLMTSFALIVVGMCVSHFFKINFLLKKKIKRKKKIEIIIPHQITQKTIHIWMVKGRRENKIKMPQKPTEWELFASSCSYILIIAQFLIFKLSILFY